MQDVIGSVGARHLDGAVNATIIDDQHLQLVDTRNFARNAIQDKRQCIRFIITGNLHDKFHELLLICASLPEQAQAEHSYHGSENKHRPCLYEEGRSVHAIRLP